MADRYDFVIAVDDRGTPEIASFRKRAVSEFGKVERSISRNMVNAMSRFSKSAFGAFRGLTRAVFSFKGALLGLGLGYLAKQAIGVASGFQDMRVSLDTITKGKGVEWFEKLNKWALKMPINTGKAIQAFTQMRAMGLKPTIADMTTLVDTASALGGGADTMMSISQALGQMKTKGQASMEQLIRLAERGVPVFEILKEQLKLTDDELQNLATSGREVDEVIAAIVRGMDERFGGQSTKIAEKWSGLTESLKSYWNEFVRVVMDSGVLAWMEDRLKGVVDWLDDMTETGKLKAMGEALGKWIVTKLDKIWNWLSELPGRVANAFEAAGKTIEWFGDKIGWLSDAFDAVRIAYDWYFNKIAIGFSWLANRIEDIMTPVFAWLDKKFAKIQSWLSKISEKGGALGTIASGVKSAMELDAKATSFLREKASGLVSGSSIAAESTKEVLDQHKAEFGARGAAIRQGAAGTGQVLGGVKTSMGSLGKMLTAEQPERTFSQYGPMTNSREYNINISGSGQAGGGSSEDDLALKIKRQIENLETRGAL